MQSVLSSLTAEEADYVLELSRDHSLNELVKVLARPKPEGLAIKVHRSALHRFLQHAAFQKRLDSAPGLAAWASKLAPRRAATPAPIEAAALQVFQQDVLQQSVHRSNPEIPTNSLANWFLRRQDSSLREREIAIAERRVGIDEKRLALDREKYEFEASKLIIEHFDCVKPIVRSDEMTNEQKIRAVRLKVFGAIPGEHKPEDFPDIQVQFEPDDPNHPANRQAKGKEQR